MSGIQLSFSQTLQELEAARTLMRDFLENGQAIIPELKSQLQSLRQGSLNILDWEVQKSRPLRTVISKGESEPGGGGAHLVGHLSFLWRIERLRERRAREPSKLFRVLGKASTVARIFEVGAGGSTLEELAMWRMEVGDDDSPGCHFHVQIRGEGGNPFPSTLSVPRFPGCLPTPLAALEFLIAEIFQDSWKHHVAVESDELKRWRSIQKSRFSRLLDWQRSIVGSESASPLAALKMAKPKPELFLE